MNQDIAELTGLLEESKDVLVALGDETRLHILLEMLKADSQQPSCQGMRVGQICRISNLSRPALSHHIGILKAAGIIKCHRQGSMNFYYLDAKDTKLNVVIKALSKALEISEKQA
jgi:ArsR family transcriptional regulator